MSEPKSDTINVLCDGGVHGGSTYTASDGVDRWDICGCPVPAEPDADNIAAVWAVKEAFRYYIDASEAELSDAGLSRSDALARAREMDAALPNPWRDDGTGRWARGQAHD